MISVVAIAVEARIGVNISGVGNVIGSIMDVILLILVL